MSAPTDSNLPKPEPGQSPSQRIGQLHDYYLEKQQWAADVYCDNYMTWVLAITRTMDEMHIKMKEGI